MVTGATPAAEDVQALEADHRALRSPRTARPDKERHRAAMLRAATTMLLGLTSRGTWDDDLVVTTGFSRGVPHLITTRSGVVRNEAPLLSSAATAIADIAMQILQARALGDYVRAVEAAGGDMAAAWEAGVLHHPAMLMLEHASRRLAPAGTRQRRSGLFVGGRATGALGNGEVSLSVGTHATGWSPGRPTRLTVGISLPDTVLASLPGMRLAEIVEGVTADHHRDAYGALTISEASATRNGSNTTLVLEPAGQVARGPGPASPDAGVAAAWRGIIDTRQSI